MRTLRYDITKTYIQRLSSWMSASTEEISRNESWVPVSVLERNKSSFTISHLPLAFRSVMTMAMDQIDMMMQSLGSESTKSEDAFVLFQETQESVRVSFLNCLLDFAGHLEHIGSKLGQNLSNNENVPFQNGYPGDLVENLSDPLPGSITNPHQQLLMVLSNLGFCKDDLSREMHTKYKHIWMQPRAKDDEDNDVEDLARSFSGIEEKVLAQYTIAKGIRDASVELLHTLIAVHSELIGNRVKSCASPEVLFYIFISFGTLVVS